MKTMLSTTSIAAALLAAPLFAQTTVVTEPAPDVTEIQTDTKTTGGGAAGGATSGAIAGAVVGGPVGAVIGAAAGAVAGDISEDALTPETKTYVLENRTQSVALESDVVVGAQVPLNSPYSYVYVEERPVLVEPQSRQIMYIYE